MNKIILMGRLTADPSYRTVNDKGIAMFNVAVNRKFKREGFPDADFFNCFAYGKTADFVNKYSKKGSRMLLTGSVQNNEYTNKEGAKVYGVQVIVEDVEFGDSKKSSNENTDPTKAETDSDGFMNIPSGIDDELPFA